MTVTHQDPEKQREQEAAQERLRSVLRGVARDIHGGMEEAAKAWKECAATGSDMAPKLYVIPPLITLPFLRLVAGVADGKMLLGVALELLSAPPTVRNAMRDVSIPTQEKFLAEGVEVWRDGSAQRARIGELLEHEARSLVDPNSGRELSAEEKAERARLAKIKRAKRTDTELRGIYLTPEQQAELDLISRRKATSKNSLVLAAMIKDGLISPRKRTRSKTATQEKGATDQPGGTQ